MTSTPTTAYTLVLPNGLRRTVVGAGEETRILGADSVPRQWALQGAYDAGWCAPPSWRDGEGPEHDFGLLEAWLEGNADHWGHRFAHHAPRHRKVTGVRRDGGPCFGAAMHALDD